MKSSTFCYTCIVALAAPVIVLANDEIKVRVSVATAEVAPNIESKQMLVPSDLEYSIEVDMRCEDPGLPRSLSLGVADTRHNFNIAEHAEHLAATFKVPSQQLAPLVTQGYCVADDPDSQTTITIEGAFTAQISLRCESDDWSSVVYLSQPLSVRLFCTQPDSEPLSSSETDR
jgi:hypothetical protein